MSDAIATPGRPPAGGSSLGPALHVRNLSKAFLGTQALVDFSVDIAAGEIHVLVGQNGSGKSTLIKVLSGFHMPTSETAVEIDGKQLRFGESDHSYRLGCRFVHQDLALIDTLTVADNLLLSGGFPTAAGTIIERRALKETEEALARVDAKFSPDQLVETLSASEKSQVAIARALKADRRYPARLLVLDEPTAALPPDEVDLLLSTLRTVAAHGSAVLYVTHHLDEVFSIGDAVTVLRNGVTVHSSRVGDVTRSQLVEHLIGEPLPDKIERVRELRPAPKIGSRPPLAVDDLHVAPVVGVTLAVQAGEIVGVGGRTGSGRETLLSAIFGARPVEAGEVRVDGAVVQGGASASVARGVAYLPGDRKREGGVMTLSALENASLPTIRTFRRRLRIDRKRERAAVNEMFADVDVRPADAEDRQLQSFSGGNQQKVLFAKWRLTSPKVFLLDDPTQGVDVGAKAMLHQQLFELADEGCAVLMSSTDVEELAEICHRILIMRDGRVTSELCRDEITVSNVNRTLVGA